MRIKMNDVVLFVITFLIIANLHILDFGDYAAMFRYITTLISVGLAAVCIFDKSIYRKISELCGFYNKWILAMIILLAVEVFNGIIAGAQSLRYLLGISYPFSWLLLYYPIAYIIQTGKLKKLISIICFWTLFALLLKTTVWWFFNLRGQDIMHYVLYQFGGSWQRNGLQRIPDTCFSGVLLAVMLNYAIVGKKFILKIMSILVILFQLWYVMNVYQARSQMLVLLFVIAGAVFFSRIKKTKKFILCLLVVVAGIILVCNSNFQDMIEGLNDEDISIATRVDAINYFWRIFKDHWLFGLNYVEDFETLNPYGTYYFSDIGIMGDMFQMGIAGLCILIIPLVRFITTCKKYFFRMDNDFIFGVSLAAYICLPTIVNFSTYDTAHLFSVPFAIAYFEYVRYRHNLKSICFRSIKAQKVLTS